MEDRQEKERLYRQVLSGDRARLILEELELYRLDKGAAISARLATARTPDEAYAVACEHKALVGLLNELKARITVGQQATDKIIEEGY